MRGTTRRQAARFRNQSHSLARCRPTTRRHGPKLRSRFLETRSVGQHCPFLEVTTPTSCQSPDRIGAGTVHDRLEQPLERPVPRLRLPWQLDTTPGSPAKPPGYARIPLDRKEYPRESHNKSL